MTDQAIAPQAGNALEAPKSPICPNCGNPFKRKSYQQSFCGKECKIAFQNRAAAEGRAIVALAKAWRASRNAKANREIGAQCLAELCSILDSFNSEDRAAGRPSPIGYAKGLLAQGRYIDRQRSK